MGSSPTKPTDWPKDSAGIKLAWNRALKNSFLRANEIQTIFAAANGDQFLDATEAHAYEEIFADVETKPFITALKGATGESFSGGGIRACALALSMEKSILPPTLGLTHPLSPLSFVTARHRDVVVNNAALAGTSFGGTYCYLIFSK